MIVHGGVATSGPPATLQLRYGCGHHPPSPGKNLHDFAEMDYMTLADFEATLTDARPPAGLAPLLLALWHDAKGDWELAHETAQRIEDAAGAWVHAYLHRKEGDLGNATYWYRRAGQPVARDPLGEEWRRIATALLDVRA
jgi:hypothetical protein